MRNMRWVFLGIAWLICAAVLRFVVGLDWSAAMAIGLILSLPSLGAIRVSQDGQIRPARRRTRMVMETIFFVAFAVATVVFASQRKGWLAVVVGASGLWAFVAGLRAFREPEQLGD